MRPRLLHAIVLLLTLLPAPVWSWPGMGGFHSRGFPAALVRLAFTAGREDLAPPTVGGLVGPSSEEETQRLCSESVTSS